MSRKVDDYQKRIAEQMEQELQEIERELAMHPEITAMQADESIKQRIDEKIEGKSDEKDYEKLISQLPEEYREDMLLGRKYREEQDAKAKRRVYVYWKRVAAAVLVVVVAASVGINSVGGPKRIVELFETMVGDREVDRVTATTNEDKVDTLEKEESEAYQKIKDELGIDPVRFVPASTDIKFKSIEIDPYLQTAYLIYDNNGRNISYIIQCFYSDGAWGTDIEEKALDEYQLELEMTVATVKEYELEESKLKRYEARFEYQGVEYQLIATMDKEDFEILLKKLHFL